MHSFSTDQYNRNRLYILIGVISALIYIEGIRRFGLGMGFTIGIISIALYILFVKFIWKWKWLHRWNLVSVPDLNGCWEGYLYTSAPEESIPEAEIIREEPQIYGFTKMEASIKIEQTWDKIRVTLDGPQSSSHSRAATILVEQKAWPTLSYNYWNEGGNTSDQPGPHYGSAFLEYDEDEDKLEGRYFNRPDHRGTHGILDLERV